ncbi:uncharacterized protein [Branchiostoma lanceolatum]|uniref:uncharacterized protein n=1 Tax=Branchiostoma lanceolatum TaxID=7740 RepID=UPI003454B078
MKYYFLLKMITVRLVQMFLLALIAMWLGAASSSHSDDVSPVVTTASGKVRGTVQYTNDLPDKPVYTFKGIPYAAPPVGDLRFRAPQPAAPWEGVRDASQLGPYCPQDDAMLKGFPVHYHHATFNEDCLTLNIETPSLHNNVILPVLLWIHGGGLFAGAGGMWPYASLAAHQDVVVVTINYRLGPFGFLSTGDENAPGNVGFLDQVQAMIWVKENIRSFGGDPDGITIFGESAGGASVCYHVISPLSEGLFHRAISQSGVCETVDIIPNPLERAVMLAEDLGCDTEDTAVMVTCLRQKSSDDLVASHGRLHMKLQSQGVLFLFMPVVDGTYLPDYPKHLLDKGQVNVAQYLLGANDHEYGWRISLGTIPNFGQGMSEEEFIVRLEMLVTRLYPTSKQDGIIATLREEYSYHDNPDDPMAIQNQFTQVYGDQLLVAPTAFVAEKYAGLGQVYLYENRYVSSVASAGRPDWVGCDHADELPILAGLAFLDLPVSDDNQRPYVFSDEDRKISLDMMAYWTNFARTGNPSDRTGGPADSPTVPEWPHYTPDNPAYMKLDLTSSSDVGMKPEKMKLWNDVFPKLAASSDRDELYNHDVDVIGMLVLYLNSVTLELKRNIRVSSIRRDLFPSALFTSASNLSDDVSPVVTAPSGKVRGTVQYTNDLPDKPVYTFKGIPYAAPPVGDLRFRAPQPAAPWEGVRDATELGPYCPQDDAMLKAFDIYYQQYIIHEDCLTLNVETPSIRNNAILPVLLWIHGGGLSLGAGGMWPYASLAAHQDVVVVTINYRLGALGFLSTGDENAPGNFGLLDQVQAMRWVKENIRSFGGDPDRITIFGTSAGGASVCFHAVSPLTNGLFNRAISQSGVCLDTINPEPHGRAVMLAEDLGCDTEDTATMVTCLRQKSSDDLVASHRRLQMKLRPQGVLFPFLPVVDGTYLPCRPKDILGKCQCQLSVGQYLLGMNDHEFGFRMPSRAIPNFGQGMSEEDFIFRLGMLARKLYPTSKQDDIMAALLEEYSYHGNSGDPMAIQNQFTQVYGDQFVVAPAVLVAEKYAGLGQVYLYENRYVSSVASAGRPDWVGCDHTDELPILAGLAFLDRPVSDGGQSPFSDEDKKTSLDMMAYWANFARTGNPSDRTGGPADSPTVPEWPQYTPDNPAYMKLDLTSSADVGLKPEKMKLWNDVFPKLAASSDRDEL